MVTRQVDCAGGKKKAAAAALPNDKSASKEALVFTDFDSLPLRQNEGQPVLQFETLDAALDDFFAKARLRPFCHLSFHLFNAAGHWSSAAVHKAYTTLTSSVILSGQVVDLDTQALETVKSKGLGVLKGRALSPGKLPAGRGAEGTASSGAAGNCGAVQGGKNKAGPAETCGSLGKGS